MEIDLDERGGGVGPLKHSSEYQSSDPAVNNDSNCCTPSPAESSTISLRELPRKRGMERERGKNNEAKVLCQRFFRRDGQGAKQDSGENYALLIFMRRFFVICIPCK